MLWGLEKSFIGLIFRGRKRERIMINGTTVGTRKFIFRIEITGIGDTPEEAWLDATESFDQNPGETPTQYLEEDNYEG